MYKLKNSYYGFVIYRVLIILFIFFICRFLFYWLNMGLFPKITFNEWLRISQGGLVFDIAAMFYFNIVVLVLMTLPIPPAWRMNNIYQKCIKYLFILTNSVAVLLNCIDFIYFRFTLRRTTVPVIKEFQHEKNGGALAINFLIDFWYVALIFIALIALLIWLNNRFKVKLIPYAQRTGWRYFFTAVLFFFLTIFLAVGGVRGGYKHSTRPITISNGGDYVNNPNEVYLVLNTPFVFVRTFNIKGLEKINYFKEEELSSIYSPVHTPDTTNVFMKKNVVLIILESFGKEAVGFYNPGLDNGTYTGFTPFLDSLAAQSKVYWNSFANGRKSIDAIPSSMASVPSGLNPFVLTPYVSDTLQSLGHILKNEGYHTSFFHGAPNGSMGFSAITRLLGVDHYYGKNEFNNDAEYDGIWGIWDEPFFNFFNNQLKKFRQPFFSTIFSVSSHHPFKVPGKYKNKFKKGPLPVLECIGYTDHALREFFNKAQKEPWFNNTLFVITADHATISYHKEYQNAWGDIAIPILLYAPGDSTLRGIDNGIIQQIDIMPTVLGYLRYNKPFIAYGNNVLNPGNAKNGFAFQYSGEYRWFENDYVLFFDGKKIKGLYNYHTDRLFLSNIADQEPLIAQRMERKLKAFIQQYNNRLVENRLTVK